MPRKPEYQEFLDQIGGRKPDPLPADEEAVATPEEIGWWKKEQVRRAIHHARHGVATPVELHLLEEKGIPVSPYARNRTKKKTR